MLQRSWAIKFTNIPTSECRPAIAWATWDLIAMVESGAHHGPATHAVTFVWNGQEVIDNSSCNSLLLLIFDYLKIMIKQRCIFLCGFYSELEPTLGVSFSIFWL